MKVGLVNLFGRSVLSISSKNGDCDIWWRALLMASSPKTCNIVRTREWGIGPLSFSPSYSSLLLLKWGGETVLSFGGSPLSFPMRVGWPLIPFLIAITHFALIPSGVTGCWTWFLLMMQLLIFMAKQLFILPPHSFATEPLAPSIFPPPRPCLHRTGLPYW